MTETTTIERIEDVRATNPAWPLWMQEAAGDAQWVRVTRVCLPAIGMSWVKRIEPAERKEQA